MARGVARDHDEKRAAIRKGAAAYFAAHGYDRASMAGAAQACGVSKALIYHYHDSKQALLFDILTGHLSSLCDAVETTALQAAAQPPEARLRAVIRTLLLAYRDADAEHKLQVDALETLSPERQAPLRAQQRQLVAQMAAALEGVAPALAGSDRLFPVTMTVFGMVNWFYMWHRPGKGIGRETYADLVADMVLGGVGAVIRQPQ